jgi:AcrR family transcriptional regulator
MDRRVKYTKKVIKDTFIDLLDKKDISKVTVSEICKIADVNRATFYRYYLDVFDLLEKMEQEFVEDVKAAYGTKDSEK